MTYAGAYANRRPAGARPSDRHVHTGDFRRAFGVTVRASGSLSDHPAELGFLSRSGWAVIPRDQMRADGPIPIAGLSEE
jgi:hypothetical protein